MEHIIEVLEKEMKRKQPLEGEPPLSEWERGLIAGMEWAVRIIKNPIVGKASNVNR